MKKIAIAFIVVCCMMFGSIAYARNVNIDEKTFNQIVADAQKVEVMAAELEFYKNSYFEMVEKQNEVNNSYLLEIEAKNALIQSQANIIGNYDITMERYDELVDLQDKQILTMKRQRTFLDIVVGGIAAGGIAGAVNDNRNGLAAGIGVATLLYYSVR